MDKLLRNEQREVERSLDIHAAAFIPKTDPFCKPAVDFLPRNSSGKFFSLAWPPVEPFQAERHGVDGAQLAAQLVATEGEVNRGNDMSRIGAMQEPDLITLWEEHTRDEFTTRDVESTLATMVEDAYVNHIPVMTGGSGKIALRTFYGRDFIPCMPPDTTLTPISRTVGKDQLVDEMVFSFTHTQEMPWMLPGIPPTHCRVEIPLVAIVHFRDGKLAHEHIYWDQASVLKQIGLLNDPALPVFGVETARKLTDSRADPRD